MLADFGLARIVETSTIANFGPKSRKTDAGAVGTAAWMAPENGDPDNPDFCGLKSDMYSLAMLLFELDCGEVPWKGLNTCTPTLFRRFTCLNITLGA